MKKLLLAILLSMLSYISYAPILSTELKEEKQKIINRSLLVQAFPSLTNIVGVYTDIRDLPLISPIDTVSLKRVNSKFGLRIHPVLDTIKFHKGIDLDCPIGTKVFSTADGYVEEIKISKFGYGNYILINHANGYKTRYAHLRNIIVKVGQFISANEMIGITGRSGLVTGPHLHYEIIKDDKPIDPILLVTNNRKEYINVLKRIQDYESRLV